MRMESFARVAGLLAVGIVFVLLGACGMGGAMVVGKIYDDHQLLNEIRKTRDQEIVNAAERVRQFQQQQGAATPAK